MNATTAVVNAVAMEANEPRTKVALNVNGTRVEATVPDRLLLCDFLREHLGLTALKVACGEGACGACTVVIGREPARSCTLLAVQADGADVLTLEGIGASEGLNRVQELFRDKHALQCGYCTPGWLVTVHCMIERGLRPGSAEAGQYLSGHLCRCTGYRNILAAISEALAAVRK